MNPSSPDTDSGRSLAGDILFLLITASFFLLYDLGRGSLASWDEAYYALVSRDVFRSGDWVNLTTMQSPFFDKPPLYFWVTAIFYKLLGVNEFATRLFAGLSGIGTITVLYLVGRHLFRRSVALFAAGMLLSSTDFLHYARWGVLDIPLLFFFCLAILGYLYAARRPVFYILFWVASALAVMVKGPLIILAWGALGAYTVLKRDRNPFKSSAFVWGALIFVLIVLPWHIASYQSNPDMFMRDFVLKHYWSRTLTAVEGHTGGAYFYIRTLINKFHPWVILLPLGLVYGAAGFFKKSKEQSAIQFTMIWALGVWLFFTFAVKTRLAWYILPAYPALVLLASSAVAALTRERWVRGTQTLILFVLILHFPFSDVMNQDYSSGLKAIASSVRSQVKPGDSVYLVNFHEQPAAEFYFDKKIAYIDSESELMEAMKQARGGYLVVPDKELVSWKAVFERLGINPVSRTEAAQDPVSLWVFGAALPNQ